MPCLSQLQLWFWSYGLIRLLGPSGPDVVSGSQTPRSKWWLVCEVGATVMDVWLTTSSGPKWPKCSFQVPDTNVKIYFDISWFYWIQLMIFVKMKLWFWTYGLIRLLGPSGPDVISGSQTPRSKFFLRFHELIGFISWFLSKWWPICENCSYGSGHMPWYVFWAQVAQMWFTGPRAQGQNIFWDFIIWFDLSHGSSENDGLFFKIAATALNIWLDTSFGHKWPKYSFQVADPKGKIFFEIYWFYWIHLMILEKMMSCLWKLHVWFWTYGLIGLLGTNGPYVVSGSQTPRSINFLRFHDLIGFISWFLRKCWSVSENCSYGSGHKVWYVFWAQVVQM